MSLVWIITSASVVLGVHILLAIFIEIPHSLLISILALLAFASGHTSAEVIRIRFVYGAMVTAT